MEITPAYQAALDYIFSYVDYSKTHAQNLDPANFQLDRVFALLEKIGNPHQAFPSIHIAGTKGKGSTAAFCAAALQAGGYRTGLYTSPHLQDFSERIQVDRRPISQEEVAEKLESIKPAIESTPGISTFEIITALGFRHFADLDVDIAVIEVGLGGRLDATNVLSPLVSVITSISMDHTPILGSTIEEIAAEKGGIIKERVPVVSSPQRPEAQGVIEQIARRKSASLTLVGRDVIYRPVTSSLDDQTFQVSQAGSRPENFMIPLLGIHQVENAATAWAALDLISRKGFEPGQEAIRRGFAGTHWPGRLEILQQRPYVILDAAHNPDSGRRLSESLDDLLPGKPIVLVAGVSGDKDVLQMLTPLADRITCAFATRSLHPRSLEPEALAQQLTAMEIPIQSLPTIEAALAAGMDAVPEDGILLITGSVFLVGAAREVWPLIHRGVNL